MENKPKKSKAFIITFILVLIILLVGYLLFKNKNGIFQINSTENTNKTFESLSETKEVKDLGYIDVDTANECISISVIAEEDIFKGEAVYVSGVGANKEPLAKKAIANDETKSKVIGVAMANILAGTTGIIANDCIVTGLNTDRNEETVWQIGDILYLSDTISGALTKNPPSNKIIVGVVKTVNAIDGSIKVGGAGTNIFDLSQAIKDAGIDTSKGIVYAIEKLKKLFGNIFGYEYNGGEFDANGLGEWVWDEEYGGFVWKWKGGTGGFTGPDFPDFGFEKACSNENDDDGDGFTDINDPQCHIDGIITNEYVPTHYSEEINAINPNLYACSNTLDDDNDELIDINDPQCHIDGIITNEYVPTHYSEEINAPNSDIIPTPDSVCENGMSNYPLCTINENGNCGNGAINPPICTEFSNEDETDPTGENTETNMCAVFDEHPLEFTESEKAQLAELLREFYLIAPTLKTEDDIDALYTEINRYEQLIDQSKKLTKQCYLESAYSAQWEYNDPTWTYAGAGSFCARNPEYCSKKGVTSQTNCDLYGCADGVDVFNDKYTGPTKRGGNPWFRSITIGGYVDNTKYSTPKINTDVNYVMKSHGNDRPESSKHSQEVLESGWWTYATPIFGVFTTFKAFDEKNMVPDYYFTIPNTIYTPLITKLPASQNGRNFQQDWEFYFDFDLNKVMLERLKEFELLLYIW